MHGKKDKPEEALAPPALIGLDELRKLLSVGHRPIGFYRLRDVLALIPVSRSTWWKWVAEGKAPKPVKLSPKVTAWRAADIHELIAHLAGDRAGRRV